jgi:hypothetical protein
MDTSHYWSRRLGGLLTAVLLLLVGCDSGGDNGPQPSDLEGAYTFDRFAFTVAGVDDFDLLADTLAAPPRMEFFGGNARVTLVYRLEGRSASSQIAGSFTTRSNSVTVDFSSAVEEDRRELLLPPTVRFEILNNRTQLRADQRVEDVNLRDYAPDRYGGLTQNVNGTLELRLTRVDTSGSGS